MLPTPAVVMMAGVFHLKRGFVLDHTVTGGTIMQIVPMTLFEYTLAFSKERTHLSDRNIIKANTRGRMFSMQEEEGYIGFICTAYEYENEIITYAFTKEQFRNRGVFASLAEHVFHTSDRNVRLEIRVDHPCFKQIDNSLRRINCCDHEGLHYYLLENNDLSVWIITHHSY